MIYKYVNSMQKHFDIYFFFFLRRFDLNLESSDKTTKNTNSQKQKKKQEKMCDAQLTDVRLNPL